MQLRTALSPIGDAVEEILGEDAVVHECSCLISDHGSPRQVLHPDTPQHETGETPLLTCFTALQDVSEDMGPRSSSRRRRTRSATCAFSMT